MKHLIIGLIYVIITSSTFAQKKQNIYYFNQQDVEVTNPDSSYYSRVIQEPDSGSTFFNLIEFYKDRKVKSRGKVSEFNPNLIFQETLVRNFPNGKKASISTFKNGVLTGSEYLYFESGVLKEERFYLENKEKTYNPKRIIYKTVSIHDTAGQNFLDENGSGLVNIEEENGDWQKAIYLNGLKTGVWESYNKKENETYTDVYQDGLYISGKTTKANGEIISYQEIEKLPEFKGGLSAFGRFLGENLRYPPDAARDGIQGRIYISFIVEKDGTFSELKIAKGVRQDLDDEALRVVKLSPIWNPALKRGITQKTSYTIPVFFQLK
jgi:TonB family protein